MNDPVWFGNLIIPRWEAFAFLGLEALLAVAAALLVVGALVGVYRMCRSVSRRHR